jgi:hypothetical protein
MSWNLLLRGGVKAYQLAHVETCRIQGSHLLRSVKLRDGVMSLSLIDRDLEQSLTVEFIHLTDI